MQRLRQLHSVLVEPQGGAAAIDFMLQLAVALMRSAGEIWLRTQGGENHDHEYDH